MNKIKGGARPNLTGLGGPGSGYLGLHLLADLKECDPAVLADLKRVRRAMLGATRRLGATIVESVFHAFSPYGISGVVVIQESHLSIHTWPERAFASVDFFTCSRSLKPDRALRYLARELGSTRTISLQIKRGVGLSLRRD